MRYLVFTVTVFNKKEKKLRNPYIDQWSSSAYANTDIGEASEDYRTVYW